jgi:gas vesicle protein
MVRNNGGSGSTTLFIVSALVGVAAGMLLAPKSGRETREMIADQARKGKGLTNKLGDSEKEALSKPRASGKV